MKRVTASFDVYPSVWDSNHGMYVWVTPNGKAMQALTLLLRDAPFKVFNGTELHCTLIHCKPGTPMPDYTDVDLPQDRITNADAYNITHWIDHKQRVILVLELSSDILEELHAQLQASGFEHSYHEYNPHITIAKDIELNAETRMWLEAKNAKLNDTPLYMEFVPELFVTSLE